MVRRNNVPNPEPNGGRTGPSEHAYVTVEEVAEATGQSLEQVARDWHAWAKDDIELNKRTGTEDDGLGELYD